MPNKTNTIEPRTPLNVFAPAKINLYLHVTGRRDDGYHMLDSLVGFADIGDQITITESDELSLSMNGPFARAFTAQEKDTSRDSQNLIIRAVWALCDQVKITPNFHITLTKNLPLGGGIGGGSSNAAAVIWALMKWWNIKPAPAYLPDILLKLGADVPVCYNCTSTRMEGIGEILSDPPTGIPELPILLVNPGRPSNTENIFKNFDPSQFKERIELPDHFNGVDDFITFLETTENSLKDPALAATPDIANALAAISEQENTLFSRMSGSGSTCFGVFGNLEDAQNAAENIMRKYPKWWVRAGTLNTPTRY